MKNSNALKFLREHNTASHKEITRYSISPGRLLIPNMWQPVLLPFPGGYFVILAALFQFLINLSFRTIKKYYLVAQFEAPLCFHSTFLRAISSQECILGTYTSNSCTLKAK